MNKTLPLLFFLLFPTLISGFSECTYNGGTWFNCVACGSSGCTSCDPGYEAVGGGCKRCGGGTSGAGGTALCADCPAGKFAPTGSATCQSCPGGKYSTAKSAGCASCLPGQYSTASSGATACAPCPAGKIAPSAASSSSGCTNCPAGQYAGPGSASCTACTIGQYAPAGSSSCSTCIAGQYSSGGSGTCTNCAAGTYSGAGAQSCTPCQAGTYSLTGQSSCSICPAGQWSAAQASACSICPAGTASQYPGAVSAAACITCPAGSYSGPGAAICTSCPAGQYAAAGLSSCTPCLAGSYSLQGSASCTQPLVDRIYQYWRSRGQCSPGEYSNTGAAQCSNCPGGQYSGAGASSCIPCTPGKFSNPGSSACSDCPAGKFSAGGAAVCSICPGGQYSSAPVSPSCSICAGGTFSLAGSTSCDNCPAGKYSSGGAGSCSTCGPGKYSSAAASSCSTCASGKYSLGNVEVCSTCPAGKYSGPGVSSCITCGAGRYSGSGAASCSVCLAGQYSSANSEFCTDCTPGQFSSPGSAACSICPAGKFSKTKAGTCSTCPAGSYSLQEAGSCTLCPAGTSSPITGATALTSCSDCPGGRYSKSGASSCSICPAGFYSGPAASDCTICPDGYSSSADSSSCSICPAGQFSSAGSPSCSSCSPGEYSLPGAGSCTTCAAGQYSGAGAAFCLICAAGSFSNAGAAFCTTCIAGEYASPGSPSCKTCDPGFFSFAGAEVCTGCPGGTYSPTVGAPSQDFCIPCNPGYYSKEGARKCLMCLPGKFSLGAVEECEDCPPGLFSDEGATACYITYVTYGANVTGTSVSLASKIGNTLCAGSSMFANLGMITKIVQNIRYIKINVSDELDYAFHAWSADFLIWDIPEALTSSSESQPLPYVFSQYDMDSRFLVNYWSTLATSLIGVCVYLMLRALKLYLEGIVKPKSVAAILIDYMLLATSNFAIIQIYGSLDDIIFYTVLDLRFSGFKSGFIAAGSMIGIFLLIFGAGLLGLHFWILWKYKKLKKLPNESGVFEKFIKKFETFQVLYQDFKDTTTIRQSFFALLVIRSVITSLILASLSDKPSAQAVLFMILNGGALLFLILQGPFKEIFSELIQYFYEIIVFVVYSGVLIMAVADEMEKDAVDLRKSLGKCIVMMNAALIAGSLVFMCIEIYCKIADIYDAWLEYKAKKAALKKAKIEASSFKKDDTTEIFDFTNQTQEHMPRGILRGSPSRHRIQYADQLNTSNFLLENNNTTFEDDTRPSRQRHVNFMPQARQRRGLAHATTEPYLLNQIEFNGNMNGRMPRGSIIRPNDGLHQDNRRAISSNHLFHPNHSPQNYSNNRSASPMQDRGGLRRRNPTEPPMRTLQQNRGGQFNTTEMYTEAADLSPFNVPQPLNFESNHRNNHNQGQFYPEGENIRGNKSAANLITYDPLNTNATESGHEESQGRNYYDSSQLRQRNHQREQQNHQQENDDFYRQERGYRSQSPQQRKNQRGQVKGKKAAELQMLGAFNNKVQKEMLSQYRDFTMQQNTSGPDLSLKNQRAVSQPKIRYGN